MAQQVITGNALFQRRRETLQFHRSPTKELNPKK
jgi:hypothetical protein